MNRHESLVDQQILHYQARMKHIDELMERAEKGVAVAGGQAERDELEALRAERRKLVEEMQRMEEKARRQTGDWPPEEAGPMLMWEAVARRLEALVERLEK